MQKHARLKIVHFLSILCFAVIVGCIVTIYGHGKTLRAKLDQSQQELSANPARAKLSSLETKADDLQKKFEGSEARNQELTEKLAQREQTIQAQKEELKGAADQIRVLSSKK